MKRQAIFNCLLTAVIISAGVVSNFPAKAQSYTTTKKNGIILFLTQNLGHPFYNQLEEGLKKEAASEPMIKIEVRAGSEQSDVSGQRRIIESYAERHERGVINLKGVVIVPSDSGPAIAESVKRLNDLAVPVINVDFPIKQDALERSHAHVDAFIGTSNKHGGELAAMMMWKYLPKGGNILVLNGILAQTAAADRRTGFLESMDTLSKKYGYKVTIREYNANWNQSTALVGTESIKETGYRIDGIFAANDDMALGAGKAFASGSPSPNGRPVIIGFDAIAEAREAIKKGEITATVAQDPHEMGRQAFIILKALWKGSKVDPEILIPIKTVPEE